MNNTRKKISFVKNRHDNIVPLIKFEVELSQNQIDYLLDLLHEKFDGDFDEYNRFWKVGIYEFREKLESEYDKIFELNQLITKLDR